MEPINAPIQDAMTVLIGMGLVEPDAVEGTVVGTPVEVFEVVGEGMALGVAVNPNGGGDCDTIPVEMELSVTRISPEAGALEATIAVGMMPTLVGKATGGDPCRFARWRGEAWATILNEEWE